MDTKTVKQSVIKSYGLLAKSKKGGLLTKWLGCCEIREHANATAKAIGYTPTELAQVPTDSNLGVGCGNPAALANIKPGETVIDLGSGAGFDAFIVAKSVGQKGKVIGVDLSDDMLKLARENARKGKYEQVKFVKGDIEELPLEKNTADHVISNCVINLSLNKNKVFQEAYRVLKPGGQLSVSDIILEKDLPDFVKDSLAGHIACVSGAEPLENYLGYIKSAGFVDIQIQSKSNFPLEFMLADPQIQKLAQQMNFSLDSEEARDLASRVVSISFSARKSA